MAWPRSPAPAWRRWPAAPDLRRVLPFLTGAALAAALVLSGVALWQTLALARLTPTAGIATNATVLAREMRPPTPGAALAESVVTLLINDPALGVFTLETPHPPASVTEIWAGGTVAVLVTNGLPRTLSYAPSIPARKRRATLIALALALAIASISGLFTRPTGWLR